MKEEHKIFITYVRTNQFWQLRLKGKDSSKNIYIPQAEIVRRFFPFPKYDLKKEIQYMIEREELNIIIKSTSNGHDAYFYRAVKSGGINLSLLEPKGKELTSVHIQMLDYLKEVTLPDNAPSSLYFDVFLQFVKFNPNLFLIVDKFSNRVHTPITSFQREYRAFILLKGEQTTSLDVVTMQPVLLGRILKKEIGENEYSTWINSGKDIYTMLQEKAKLCSRDEAKKRFFEILFAPANNQLEMMFGAFSWIKWINELKQRPLLSNPHTTEKEYSNLAWLLQTTEVSVMYKVWGKLIENNIPFLSVHDEIIIRICDFKKANDIFTSVLSNELEYFKLSSKGLILEDFINLQFKKLTPDFWILNKEINLQLTNYNLQVLCDDLYYNYQFNVLPEDYYNVFNSLIK